MPELTLYADLSADPITLTTRLAPSALPLGILLREAREDDVEQLAALRAQSAGETDAAASVAAVRATLTGGDGDYLPAGSKVAVDEQNAVVAFVQTVRRAAGTDEPFVVRLHTQPPWRGRGLGRALLVEAMRAAAADAPRIGARLDSSSTDAISLCRALGFSEAAATERSTSSPAS
jgi:N-alpha-acetyltransferase 10/11